jgi:citrate synthase
VLGAADLARALIDEMLARVDSGATPDEAAEEIARERRAAGQSLPGYGHPLHKPLDPRAERMFALARERGVAGRAVDGATRLTSAAARVWGRPLPMNVSMAIAATLRDLDVPGSLVRGVPILARVAGLIAHLAEEAQTPIGFYMAAQAEAAIGYSGKDAGAAAT